VKITAYLEGFDAKSAFAAEDGAKPVLEKLSGGFSVTLDRLNTHQMIIVE
jgi:hypothetical protein